MKGKFITVEGTDGSGKSTQLKLLMDYLGTKNCDVVFTREPGGTEISEKIRDVIGAGGKVINKIIADTGVKIDIKEDGTVFVSSTDHDGVNEAIRIIESLTKEVEAGEVYLGKVTKIAAFGAFIEILPNKEGLCHISKLDKNRVEKVEDVVSVGDEILVKVTDIDSQGRINLSRKDALPQDEPTE